jgi:hypothetical protein
MSFVVPGSLGKTSYFPIPMRSARLTEVLVVAPKAGTRPVNHDWLRKTRAMSTKEKVESLLDVFMVSLFFKSNNYW